MQIDSWFKNFTESPEYKFMKDRPIVYFCAEYALSDMIPTYAGGLGILAGDLLREAAERKIPFTAIGLYYQQGYLFHDLYKEGVMIKSSGRINPESVGLKPVIDKKNKRIFVVIPIQDTYVYAQAWYMQMDTVTVYLLDTNIDQNNEENRRITDQLYTANAEMRFKQEIILSLGGLRILDALKISPIGYHLNEGHSALLALELVRHEMQKHKRTFQDELDVARQHIFFTNHTLIAAGNDTFSGDLASSLLSGFANEIQVPVSEIVSLGLVAQSNIFSMTLLALRMAGKSNAVSKLHAEKAQSIWKDHPMEAITNGVHIKTWDKTGTKEGMWKKHQKNKRDLLEYIQNMTNETWDEKTFLLGWARRIVSYKRPLALFENLKEFKKLATSDRPIRVVISGLSHENDMQGLEILKKIQKIVTVDLKGIVVYLPGYNMTLAKLLVSGCDVWLNTPIVGFEACGTSGMKASLNGVLPCSTADGWVAEAEMFKVGWLLQNENLSDNILSVLEKNIIPSYYSSDKKNWIEMMENARDMTINQFSASIMLKKYIEEFYLPVIRKHQQ